MRQIYIQCTFPKNPHFFSTFMLIVAALPTSSFHTRAVAICRSCAKWCQLLGLSSAIFPLAGCFLPPRIGLSISTALRDAILGLVSNKSHPTRYARHTTGHTPPKRNEHQQYLVLVIQCNSSLQQYTQNKIQKKIQ